MVYYQVKNRHLLKLLGGSRQGNVWGGVTAVAFSHSCQQPTKP